MDAAYNTTICINYSKTVQYLLNLQYEHLHYTTYSVIRLLILHYTIIVQIKT